MGCRFLVCSTDRHLTSRLSLGGFDETVTMVGTAAGQGPEDDASQALGRKVVEVLSLAASEELNPAKTT